MTLSDNHPLAEWCKRTGLEPGDCINMNEESGRMLAPNGDQLIRGLNGTEVLQPRSEQEAQQLKLTFWNRKLELAETTFGKIKTAITSTRGITFNANDWPRDLGGRASGDPLQDLRWLKELVEFSRGRVRVYSVALSVIEEEANKAKKADSMQQLVNEEIDRRMQTLEAANLITI